MRALNRIVCLLALGGLTAVSAQTPATDGDPDSGDVITAAWADPSKCNVSNAPPVTFREAVQSGDRLNGKCIAVEGFWIGRALFERASDGNKEKSTVSKALEGRRIGLYGTEAILDDAPERSAPYRLVGIYGHCETEWPNAMLVLGYCHYTDGPILKLSQAIPMEETGGR
jgi:hypothetical protein